MKLHILMAMVALIPASAMANWQFEGKCAKQAAQAVKAEYRLDAPVYIDTSRETTDPSLYEVTGTLNDPDTNLRGAFWVNVRLDPRTCKNAKVID